MCSAALGALWKALSFTLIVGAIIFAADREAKSWIWINKITEPCNMVRAKLIFIPRPSVYEETHLIGLYLRQIMPLCDNDGRGENCRLGADKSVTANSITVYERISVGINIRETITNGDILFDHLPVDVRSHVNSLGCPAVLPKSSYPKIIVLVECAEMVNENEGALAGAEGFIGRFERAPLQPSDASGYSSRDREDHRGPSYRVAEGAALWLLAVTLIWLGAIRVSNRPNSQPDDTPDEGRWAVLTAFFFGLGWSAGVYGTVLLLPAMSAVR